MAVRGLLFLTWWLLTHRLDRFWLPILPALAILAGLGADWVRTRAGRSSSGSCSVRGSLRNFTYISTALAGLNEWTGDLVFLRRDIPKRWNAALRGSTRNCRQTPRPSWSARPRCSILNHRVAYNTVFNNETIELLANGKSTGEFHRALADRS